MSEKECKFYRAELKSVNGDIKLKQCWCYCNNCSDNPNCYFKQLTDLKAENEAKDKEIERLNNSIDSFLKACGREESIEKSLFDEDIQDISEEIQQIYNEHSESINEISYLQQFAFECGIVAEKDIKQALGGAESGN